MHNHHTFPPERRA
uniref:Uncharacterized protein n=1 Tax=Arundo donax TaxID=35708 RepID=A0A0A9FH18_ARUDO